MHTTYFSQTYSLTYASGHSTQIISLSRAVTAVQWPLSFANFKKSTFVCVNSNYVTHRPLPRKWWPFLIIVTLRWQGIAGSLVIRGCFWAPENRYEGWGQGEIWDNYGIVVFTFKKKNSEMMWAKICMVAYFDIYTPGLYDEDIFMWHNLRPIIYNGWISWPSYYSLARSYKQYQHR